MAAANAVVNAGIFLKFLICCLYICISWSNTLVVSAARSFSSSFWRQMEPFFGFISDADIAYLKQKVTVKVERKMFFLLTYRCL